MFVTGLSHGFHDAAICYIEGNKILGAHHSERHTGIKNDRNLHNAKIKVKVYSMKSLLRRIFVEYYMVSHGSKDLSMIII